MSHDPLLDCLMLLTKYYERPMSRRALAADLPLIDNKFTPELFIRAAHRADLSANLTDIDLSKINKMILPVVLLLKDDQACVLLETEDKSARVIFPETGSGFTTINLEELSEKYSGQCFYIKPNYQFTHRSEETLLKKGRHWFWGIFLQAVPIYSEVLVASLLINCFALAIPLFAMNVYDRVVPNQAIETMWVLAIGVSIVFLFDFSLRSLRSYFIDSAARYVDVKLSSLIFQHILGIEMGSRPSSVGAFANSVQSFELFRDFITSSTVTVLVDVPFLFLYLVIIYLIGGNLVFIPLALLPIVLITGFILQMPITRLTEESYQHSAEKQATLIESLGGAEVIKSSTAESTMQRRWEQVVALAADLGVKLRIFSNFGLNASILAQQLSNVLVIIFGVYKITQGDMTMGALIACTILTGRAMAPISQLAGLIAKYHQSVNALRSLNTIMALPVDRTTDRRHLHRPYLKGGIKFNNVGFNYPGTEISAVHNISLEIKPGERVAIIGRIGSGKSTLAKLIMQLYKPTSGNILLDNTEYSQIDPADIRHNMGYVPQDINLFYGSVRDNIILGAAYVDDDKIRKAAQISGVDKFAEQHPHGYDLQVGERGQQLSRGQRQSIAVARAVLLDPPIILMDEPSTSMDDGSEAALIQNFGKYLRRNKTFVLVTHKSSMLSLVDRIIVVDNGRIVADGPKNSVLTALKQGNVSAKIQGSAS